MTDTVDRLLQQFCQCTRSLWNTYFLSDDVSDETLKRFEEIRRLLFASLVLAPLGRDDDREKGDDPLSFLQVIPGAGPVTVLVEHPSPDGDHYWEAAPKDVDFASAELQFVDFFDWDPRAFRDTALIKVWIMRSPAGIDLGQRYALFERQSVTVLEKDMNAL